MRLMTPLALLMILLVVVASCSSPDTAPKQCRKLLPVSAWLLEPEPDLQPHLDKIVAPVRLTAPPNPTTSPSAPVSSAAALN